MPGPATTVTRVATGAWLVARGDRRELVYVAGPPDNRWAFWNGHVFHVSGALTASPRRTARPGPAATTLAAPMPATVVKVLTSSGSRVTKGTSLVVLEAMKMELPIRALEDGIVKTVLCREGELVQADQPLVEMN